MMIKLSQRACVLLWALSSIPAFAEDQVTPVYQHEGGAAVEGGGDWSSYQSDDAAGSVTAASLLGISGDVVANVENIRDIVVAFKGASEGGGNGTLALAVAPARTAWSPFDLPDYRNHDYVRLLSSTTLSYAQGQAKIGDIDYERQAAAIEMSYIFNRSDDPVIAFDDALHDQAVTERKDKCTVQAELFKQANQVGGQEDDKPIFDAVKACDQIVQASLRWNRSNASFSYGQGWIKPHDGGDQSSLGKTLAVSLTYGFEHLDGGRLDLKNRAALAVTYRRSLSEPVLQTLGTASVERKDTSLLVARLTFGSDTIRALAEFSDAGSRDITASQRTFKQALGVDLRLIKGAWVNLRFGRLSDVGGDGKETASLLSLSYSPSALLN
ncbi:MAG: hypothetical protein JWQ90_4923 [Hydrocarboniphaga sp.]|uniref:hypothetical protein n=1 Tax=Hydrocarboniphaga sp. TaxID=2033016 RepID=UPI00260763E3|nr:hypothetical protein [Hydrocarboniphaga sp.]MDB5972473.1 hypothetical protein [Hydrocarboniphaga sp.]